MKESIERLLEGSIDSHIHMGPDAYRLRIADAHELAIQAKNLGMKGVVLKSHDYPTAPLAQMANKIVQGVEIIGSLCLNDGVGGINPNAVEVSARIGAKVLWMPTFSTFTKKDGQGIVQRIFILGNDGKVLPEIKEVLALVKEFDLVLCTGHISKEEIVALFAEAQKMAITKFVLTHPLQGDGTVLDIQLQKELAEKGAFFEHCFISTMHKMPMQKIVETIRYVGVERCIFSTDLGQLNNPPPWVGIRMMLESLLQCGLSEKEISILVKKNPCFLLNL
ncbi:DUF6282 family protein [Thermodesulfobacteriota bacterium]